jgi:bifunctional non-homologous end joining protein LigD
MRVLAFIEPCLPSPADRPPSGTDWIHEIKLDGFRMMVRRVLTRNGYDWTGRFPLICGGGGSAAGAVVSDGRRGGGL